jgi:hypothetical protein
LRRHAHFDELPSFKAIATALGEARQYLPAGIANWTRHDQNAATAPLRGFDGLYAASSGSDFVALAVGTEKPIELRAAVDASIDVRQTSTGKLMKRVDIKSGESLSLSAGDSFVLIGRRPSR